MTSKLCVWYDGPVVEAWQVYLRRSRVMVYCREKASAEEVRAFATALYADSYGEVLSVTREPSVPYYCTNAPAVVCPA